LPENFSAAFAGVEEREFPDADGTLGARLDADGDTAGSSPNSFA